MKIKNKDIVITMRCTEDKINKLKEMAREQSYKNNKDILYTDLIREAIDKAIIG
jgi:hypothetical protein